MTGPSHVIAGEGLERFGAGLTVRAGTITRREVTGGLERLLGAPGFTARARAARDELARWDSSVRLRAFVEETVGTGGVARAGGIRAAT